MSAVVRRRYSPEEKLAALSLARELGVSRAARRLGINYHVLYQWVRETRAFAHSSFVGRGRTIGEEERRRLLEQLIHEQELEQRFMSRKYRHEMTKVGAMYDEPLDQILGRSGVVQRHLLEWLDPTFDEVAERLAA